MPTDPLAWIDDALAALERSSLRRRRTTSPRPTGDDPHPVDFSSNDYLALAADGAAPMADAADRRSAWGSAASPLISGRGPEQAALERELADFKQTESALLFSTGYMANVGAITSVVGEGDVIYSDARNHASIIDGCRLSRARVSVYRHNDVDDLRRRLDDRSSARRALIVTDSLFSMDGDLAPLEALAELADRFGAMLMVDEAHATGVLGNAGRGAAELLGVERRVDICVGTLSKAIGSVGGFVAGGEALIDWLANRARTYVFSTAQPELVAAMSRRRLARVRAEPERRTAVLAIAEQARARLTEAGWNTGASRAQIVPIVVGAPERVMRLAAWARGRGVLAPPIRPPSVPSGESLLRLGIRFDHTDSDIDALLEALRSFSE